MSVELPFTAPADGEYEIEGHIYRLGAGTTVDENLLPTLDPLRLAQNGIEAIQEVRSICLAHLQPEPCPTCASYIAAGL